MTQDPGRPATLCQVFPVYGAGFVTAFGAHAVAANLGRYALGHGGSLWAVARLAQGTGAAAFSPAASATVAALGGQKRSRRLFGGYGGAKGVGYLLGPIAGGPVLVGAFGLISLTAGLGVLAAALLACAVLIAPRTQASPSHSPAGTA